MRVKFIEKLRFKMSGRGVMCLKVEDVDGLGIVKTLHFLGMVKKRANSLISTWDSKGWEIDPMCGTIRYIDEKGIESQIYVVSEAGRTCDLSTQFVDNPALEDVIGRAATMDDIADSMDLGKSMKMVIIGAVIGALVWAAALGPALQVVMS